MKKKILILSILIIITISFMVAYIIQKKDNPYILNHEKVKNNSGLSIMVETSEGSGTYSKDNDLDWTTGDYSLNTSKSSCANSSSITWNETTYQVSMTGNKPDKCTLYFDRVIKIVVNSSNTTATYNGQAQKISLSSPTAGAVPYYSTSTLNKDNYKTVGSTTHPTVKNAGTTKVYWCVECGSSVKCGDNDIVISKATPTFSLGSSSLNFAIGDRSGTVRSVSYNYNGDGAVTCTPTTGTYGSCSVNTSNKTINITQTVTTSWSSNNLRENFTISIAEGTNYLASSNVVLPVVFCFTGDTEVEEWDRKRKKKRKKKIKDIKEGDIVYAYDYRNDQICPRKVKKVHIAKTTEICHIHVNGEDIKTTRDHPFFVRDAGFLEASLLRPGYQLAAGNGTYYEVERVEYESLNKEVEMYCFELEDGSSFVVGSMGIAAKTIFASTVGICASFGRLKSVLASGSA